MAYHNLTGQEKMKSNKKFLGLAVVAILLGISLHSAQAVNQDKVDKIEDRKAEIEDRKVEKICVRLDAVISRLEEKIKGDNTRIRERSENRVREMKEIQATKNNELEQRRAMRDTSRENFYKELENQAGDNQEKKAAIVKFRNAVDLAIKTRRDAIDKAKEDMNKGINLAIQTRTSSTEAHRNEFEKSVEAAIAKARNACGDDASADDLKNVLAQLKSDIKSAENNYRVRANEEKKVQSAIQTLRETRKAEVKLAIENFKNAMKKAQEEFRKVMSIQEIAE